MSTTNPPRGLILDLQNEVNQLVLELKACEVVTDTIELDFVLGRHVSDTFSHLYDKRLAAYEVEAFAADCAEVFQNCSTSSGEDLQQRYNKALVSFGHAVLCKLDALGAYNQDDLLHYSFEGFLGTDVMMEYLNPLDGRK